MIVSELGERSGKPSQWCLWSLDQPSLRGWDASRHHFIQITPRVLAGRCYCGYRSALWTGDMMECQCRKLWNVVRASHHESIAGRTISGLGPYTAAPPSPTTTSIPPARRRQDGEKRPEQSQRRKAYPTGQRPAEQCGGLTLSSHRRECWSEWG